MPFDIGIDPEIRRAILVHAPAENGRARRSWTLDDRPQVPIVIFDAATSALESIRRRPRGTTAHLGTPVRLRPTAGGFGPPM